MPTDIPNKILHLGDSLTAGSIGAGELVDPITDRWCDRLLAALPSLYPGTVWEQTVLSAVGATSTLVLVTNQAEYATWTGDIVTIELGTNDGAASVTDPTAATTLSTWNDNVTSAVGVLTGNGVPAANILIFGLPPQDNGRAYGYIYDNADKLSLMRWHDQTLATATALGCTHVPMYDVYDPGVGQYNPDHTIAGNYISEIDTTDTHPNNEGYRMWYEQVVRYLPLTLALNRYPLKGSGNSLDRG
jgi:lysophospholipase L1-like esterase